MFNVVIISLLLLASPAAGNSGSAIEKAFRLTSHPAEDFMPAVTKDERVFAFVSDRGGTPNIYVFTPGNPTIATPRQVTFQPSGDKDPAISEDGKWLVYVSYGTDADGDIYLLNIQDLANITKGKIESPRRLTFSDTADREPAFTPDGKGIIFTSRPKKEQTRNLYYINIKSGKKRKLTFDGGSKADISPDGKKIVFVKQTQNNRSVIAMIDITGQNTKILSDQKDINTMPVFDGNNKVVFVHYEKDTNHDKRISIDDNPAVFAMNLTGNKKEPFPLTTFKSQNLFPALSARHLYFTKITQGNVDIYRLGRNGEFGGDATPEAELEKAIQTENYYNNKAVSELAYRHVITNHPENRDIVTQALYRLAEVVADDQPEYALRLTGRILNRHNKTMPWAGFAEIFAVNIKEKSGTITTGQAEKKYRDIKKRYTGHRKIGAKASIAIADELIKNGKPAKALALLDATEKEYLELPEYSARAALHKGKIYSISLDKQKEIDHYLSIVKRWPSGNSSTDIALGRIIDLSLAQGSAKEKSIKLSTMAENKNLPKPVSALALFRLAMIKKAEGDIANAKNLLKTIANRFKEEKKIRNRALFALAEIYANQNEYQKAIDLYDSIEIDSDNKKNLYEKSRKEAIRQRLEKGEYEYLHGDIKVALKTYLRLAADDPQNSQAHRGVIKCRISLGETKRLVADYEKLVKTQPGEPSYLYALGLSVTYLPKPDLVRAESLIRTALSKNETDPWYHQSLGWVYETMARKSGNIDTAEKGAQEYRYSLSLAGTTGSKKQIADLQLNLGNVSYLTGDCTSAITYYKQRDKSASAFENRTSETLFHKWWGECEYKTGSDKEAQFHLLFALKLTNNKSLQLELYDRLGLINQSGQHYKKAANYFKKVLKRRLAEGEKKNLSLPLRNIAGNLYFLSKTKTGSERINLLKSALSYYLHSEKELDNFVETSRYEKKGLLNIQVETGPAGYRKSARGFGRKGEEKLIVHHIGTIYAELGDYANAARYFEKKLALVPRALKILDNLPVLTEKSIVQNRLATFFEKNHQPVKALEQYADSLDICIETENANCIVQNLGAITRIGLTEKKMSTQYSRFESVIEKGRKVILKIEPDRLDNRMALALVLSRTGQYYQAIFEQLLHKKGGTNPENILQSLRRMGIVYKKSFGLYNRSVAIFRLEKNKTAKKGELLTRLNLALLSADAGDKKSAFKKLSAALKSAKNLSLPEVYWLYLYFAKSIGLPETISLEEIAQAFEKIPAGIAPDKNRPLELAIIRTVYSDLTEKNLKAGDISRAFFYAEKNRLARLKMLALAPLINGNIPDEKIAGLARLRGKSDDRKKNRPLDIVATLTPSSPETIIKALDSNEAAITSIETDGKTTLFILTKDGLTASEQKAGESIGMLIPKQIKNVYVAGVTYRVGKLKVSHLPALSLLASYKKKRSIDDSTIAIFNSRRKALPPLISAHFEKVINNATTDDIESAGVVVLEKSGALTTDDLLREGDGSVIVIVGGTDSTKPDYINNLSYLSMLAGFSSMIVADKNITDTDLGRLLVSLKDKSAAHDDMPAFYTGAMPFNRDERLAYAKKYFADKIKKGIALLKKGETKKAYTALSEALVYTSMAKLYKFRPIILDRLAQTAFRLKRYDLSLAHQEELNRFYETKGDKLKLAESLYYSGIAKIRTGDYKNAVADFDRSIAIFEAGGATKRMADLYNKRGLALESAHMFSSAISSFELALAQTKKQITTLRRIGRVSLAKLYNYDSARKYFGKAKKIAKADGDKKMEATLTIDLAVVEQSAGDLDREEALLNEAWRLAKQVDSNNIHSRIKFHMANVAWFRSQYEAAFDNIEESARLAEEGHNNRLEVMALNTKGLIYHSLNKQKKSLETFDRALELSQTNKLSAEEASTLNNIGLAYRSSGEYEKALGYFARAEAIDITAERRWGEAYTKKNRALTLIKMNRPKEAIALAREAIAITDDIGDRINGAKSSLALAFATLESGNAKKAFDLFETALKRSTKIGLRENMWRAIYGKAESLLAMGNKKDAVKNYMKAIDLVESLQNEIKTDQLKTGFLDDKQALYEALVLLLVDEGKNAQAFRYAERARGRAFIDMLGNGKLKFKNDYSKTLYKSASRLKQKISAAYKKGDKSGIKKMENEYAGLLGKIKKEEPDLLPFVDVASVGYDQIKEKLGAGTLLLEYMATEKALIIFAVTQNEITAYTIKIDRVKIGKLVHDLRARINAGLITGEIRAKLSAILLQPLKSKILKAKRIGIIPHGPIHYVSFAFLPVNSEYLVERLSLFYAPSASVLARQISLRGKIDIKKTSVMAIGNPDLGIADTDLPLAEIEAKSIGWIFPDVTTLIRSTATETRFIENAGAFGILHLASHGQFDPIRPLDSALLLSPDKKNDGKLKTKDVFSLSLNADLVTLSACQTGLGSVSRGDEVVGLNRAFLYAGARTILSTLWRVDDMASAILIKHFYRYLKTNEKAEALRLAQLKVKAMFPHPSAWAGFVLVGDYL